MKKIMISSCLCLLYCGVFSVRTLIHASENVAISIGGDIEDYCFLRDKNNDDRFILYCYC